jgi:hypothetical protein
MAATSKPATTMAAAAATATTAMAAAAATTASAAGQLYGAANIFSIEEMKRSKADVLHFLFAKDEALIGRSIVGLRDMSSRYGRSRCTTEQRKTQSGRTQRCHGSSLGCAFLPRSLLDPSHGRILCSGEAGCPWQVCARREGRASLTSVS